MLVQCLKMLVGLLLLAVGVGLARRSRDPALRLAAAWGAYSVTASGWSLFVTGPYLRAGLPAPLLLRAAGSMLVAVGEIGLLALAAYAALRLSRTYGSKGGRGW